MDLDPDQYQYTGGEFLDRLDNLEAVLDQVHNHLEEVDKDLNGDREFKDIPLEFFHSIVSLKEAHQDLNELFENEVFVYPIQVVREDEDGNYSFAIKEIETEAEDYGELVVSLAEINENLGERDPRMDYTNVPSPCAIIDYSDELIEDWERLNDAYSKAEKILEARISFNGDY